MNHAVSRPCRTIGVVACALALAACTAAGTGDAGYRPWVGQAGKDVMWVPTFDAVAARMLEVAGVKADDIVYDLGSGDGKIPILAASRYGAKAVGIEYGAELSALARRNAERAGVTDRVTLIHGDIFKEDFSAATVLTLYLGRDLNLRLKPVIARMRPGTRVVSNSFDMGVWEPDRVVEIPEHNPIYLWVVPARVQGDWSVSGLPGTPTAALRLVQTFQKVEGTLALPGGAAVPVRGRLDGARLSLDYADARGAARRWVADVDADTLRSLPGPGGPEGVSGRRVR